MATEMEIKYTCPHCGFSYDKPLKRKRACSSCGIDFYVRNSQTLLPQKLFKHTDALAIDLYEVQEASFESAGLGIKEYRKIENILEKKKGYKPQPSTVIWEMAIRVAKDDPSIYYGMAIFLGELGRNPNQALEKNAKRKLLEYKKSSIGIKYVEILSSGNGCSSCNSQKKKYTVDEALAIMPLPNKKCTHYMFSDKYAFCRCDYLAVLD
jgi:transposase-like protein